MSRQLWGVQGLDRQTDITSPVQVGSRKGKERHQDTCHAQKWQPPDLKVKCVNRVSTFRWFLLAQSRRMPCASQPLFSPAITSQCWLFSSRHLISQWELLCTYCRSFIQFHLTSFTTTHACFMYKTTHRATGRNSIPLLLQFR